MKKICIYCLSIFESFVAHEYCPLADCSDGYLVEIDDQMVDVMRGLWARDISTKFCCSGHLYEGCFNPYLMFDGFYSNLAEMDLSGFRELLIAVNSDGGRVVVEEIFERDEEELFVVRSACDLTEKNPKQRLKHQVDFVGFLYDVLDRIDALIDEAAEQEPVSVCG